MQAKTTHAGVLVYRQARSGPEFLLVSTSKSPHERVFPKGHIEEGEDAETAALREAREEAGVTAHIIARLGETAFTTGSEPVRAVYFLAEYVADVAADETRSCEWLGYAEAHSALTFDDTREILTRAGDYLTRRRDSSGDSR